jgi:hypothetical protein
MQEGIIRIMKQFLDGAPVGPSGVNSKWHSDCGVLARENCKIVWSNWGAIPESEKDTLWEQIKRTWQKGYYPYHRECPSKVQTWTQLVLRSDW